MGEATQHQMVPGACMCACGMEAAVLAVNRTGHQETSLHRATRSLPWGGESTGLDTGLAGLAGPSACSARNYRVAIGGSIPLSEDLVFSKLSMSGVVKRGATLK